MKLSEICIVKTWSERFDTLGRLSLLHVNDTLHVVEYKDSERSIAVDVDFVELNSLDNTIRFTFPRGSGDRLVFSVEDENEFSILCQAKEDCQAICDLKLRLNSIMRDSYYSGVYSSLDPDGKIVICDEMDRLKKENPGMNFSSLLNSNEQRVDMANRLPRQNKPAIDANMIHLSEVVCVFCAAAKLVLKDLDFIIHPNVPKTSSGKSNYMCSVCIENWKEYREIAEHEGQLVLPGEVNEEICAICSDTPSTLVLCGACPRSFCNNCLTRILTPAEYAELMRNDDVDWICVCCNAGVNRNPPLARTAWKMVGSGNGKRGGHHVYGTIVPYSKSAQSAALSKALLLSASESQDQKMDRYVVDAAVSQSAPLLASLVNRRANTTTSVPIVTTPSTGKRDRDEDNDDNSLSLSTSRRRAAPSKLLEKTPPPVSKAARTAAGGVSGVGGGVGMSSSKGGVRYEELDTLVSLQAQNKAASSHNNRNKRMEKRYRDQPANEDLNSDNSNMNDSAGGAPVAALDEKYYFTQYVGYYSLLCEVVLQRQAEAAAMKGKPGKRKRVADILTDDVCFLCKDGGELIECDWQCPSAKNGERCLKVYHTNCLNFDVSDEKWCCPRHYCDMCGSQTLKYICKYCPVSICASCPEKMVAKYGHARYSEVADPLAGVWCHTPNAPGVQAIVCHSCTEMLEQIVGPVDKDRDSSSSGGGGGNGAPPKMITISCNSMTGIKGSAPFSVLEAEIRTQKRFPGAYMGETKGGGGSSSGESVFRRDLQSGSSDERTSNSTDPIVFAPPKKKKQQQHGKGKSRTTGKGQRRGCTRWTDEESEALLEAVEIHGDDAQAIKADPEFADRLDRRSGESIKQKMERENMFGDSSSDDDDDGENGSGDEGGAADGERGMEVENEVVAAAAAAITSTTSGAVGSVPLAGNQSGSSAVNKGKCTDGEKAQDVPVVRRDASEESAGVLNTKVGKAKQQSGTTTQLASASAGDVLASTVGAEKELEKEKEKEAEAAAVEEKETEMESGACTSRARGRLAKTAAASPLLLADDVSVASSHKSAASRATATSSSSTAAVLKRSSPRPTTSTEAATKGPTVGGGAGSAAATSCTTTAAGTSSKKAAALPPKVTVEHKPKGRNFELMALLSDSHRPPLPPRRQSKPTTSAPTQATRVAASVAVSDSESEESEESDDEADTIQVSRVLTRRQEQEQEQALVSTRSGKKLYLAGSDLLP